MNKKKGFTLIELLAVIVILAIIALIATPLIMNIINDAKRGAFLDSSYAIVKAAEQGYAKTLINGKEIEETEYTFNNKEQVLKNGNVSLNFKGSSPEYGNIIITDEGKVAINFYSGGWCATKGYDIDTINIRKVDKQEDCVPDVIAPIITLEGGEITITESDTSYTEPGYNAIDDKDGDITNKVIITNNINYGVEGEYEVTYTITDLAGNKTIVKRKIIIIENVLPLPNTYYWSTYYLMPNGTVKASGDNNYGQLGDGTSSNNRVSIITIDELTNVKQISTGAYHTAFLMANGTVKVTGYDYSGQLGLGSSGSLNVKAIPTLIPNLNNVKQVAAGGSTTMFLMEDGTVKATGANSSGQFGDGTTTLKTTPTTIPNLNNVKEIVIGGSTTYFLMIDGTVKATGNNQFGGIGDGTTINKSIPTTVLNLSNVKQIAAGLGGFALFLLNDGTVKSVGNNVYGQLGDGTMNNKSTIVSVKNLTHVKQVAVNNRSSMFLMEDGTVKVIGENLGNFGFGGNAKTTMTSLENIYDVSGIFMGYGHTIFLMNDGRLKGIGKNNYGQLGNGTNVDEWYSFIDIPLE